MTLQKISITVIILILSEVSAIWPPSYKINLSHEETFVISELLTSDDTDDIYDSEDEMIKEQDLTQFNLEKDTGKYLNLHQLTVRRNGENIMRNKADYNKQRLKKFEETNFEKEELKPWKAGFVDRTGNFKSKDKKIDLSKLMKNIKRQHEKDVNYDYGSLKAEYYSNIKQVKVSNETLNFTEIKEEETFNDAIKAIVSDNKQARNCTVEEMKGIGLKAAECLWSDLTKPDVSQKERSSIFHRIGTIILIWFLVYLLIAIPCWCQKGWCCCCFQCKFCKPGQRIDKSKKYLLDNPVGVYHTPENKKVTYSPTNYEKYAQKKLEKALLKL